MSEDSGQLVNLAREIATKAHAGQYRRDGSTPYIEHPRAVVARVGTDPQSIAAAWLHDVLEDTDETPESLIGHGLPPAVVQTVELLTKSPDASYDDYLDRIAIDSIAKGVKVADMLANLSDSPTEKQIRKYASGLLRLLPDQ